MELEKLDYHSLVKLLLTKISSKQRKEILERLTELNNKLIKKEKEKKRNLEEKQLEKKLEKELEKKELEENTQHSLEKKELEKNSQLSLEEKELDKKLDKIGKMYKKIYKINI